MRLFLTVLFTIFVSFSAFGKGVIYMMHPEGAGWKPCRTEFQKGSPLYNIRQAFARLGYDAIWTNSVRGLKDYDYIICWDIPHTQIDTIKRIPKEKLIAFLWEPPVVLWRNYDAKFQKYFSKIITWEHSVVDNKRFFSFYYPVGGRMISSPVPFGERKFSVMVNRDKDSKHRYSLYGERRNVINYFENNHSDDFDLYGYGWSTSLKNYKGTIPSVIGCIKDYKFCFCYENTHSMNGYVTEKIFNAFKAGCVPIYWGAPNATDYIPQECFVDRRNFEGTEDLYHYLKAMTEEEHQRYLDNIRAFLETDGALCFSWEHVVDVLLDIIEPGYDKALGLTEYQRKIVQRVNSYLTQTRYKQFTPPRSFDTLRYSGCTEFNGLSGHSPAVPAEALREGWECAL